MKFFIIDTYYLNFLDSFYDKNKELKDKSYYEQKRAIVEELFGTADFYSKNLKKLGHDAEEYIINNEILQKQWAKEKGIKIRFQKDFLRKFRYIRHLRTKEWVYKILEEQIKKYKPDIIYSKNLQLDTSFLQNIKKHTKLLVGQIACSLPPKKYFKPYNLIISALPYYVERFRKWGKNSEYLPLAFEPTILPKLRKTDKQYDVVHVGGYGSPFFDERKQILEKAAKTIKIDFWGYGVDNFDQNNPILKNYHGESWGIDMYNTFYNSKICLNCHGDDIVENYAANMRLYEITGVGAMLITDMRKDLSSIFKIGEEIVVYNSAEELIEKVEYYLSHEEERKKIAKAGQERTLRDHAWENRMKKLLEYVQKYI